MVDPKDRFVWHEGEFTIRKKKETGKPKISKEAQKVLEQLATNPKHLTRPGEDVIIVP